MSSKHFSAPAPFIALKSAELLLHRQPQTNKLLTLYRTTCCLLITLVLSGFSALAQTSQLQVGLGAWPGAGFQAGHVLARSVYTLEVITSVDSELWNERTPLHLSAGVGTALRPLGVLRVIGRANYEYDLYLGVRFGPALTFLQKATRAEKNRQFSLFLDPYIRYTASIGRQPVFVEIGSQRPSFRFGLWVAL